jgi:hypothetical protein
MHQGRRLLLATGIKDVIVVLCHSMSTTFEAKHVGCSKLEARGLGPSSLPADTAGLEALVVSILHDGSADLYTCP